MLRTNAPLRFWIGSDGRRTRPQGLALIRIEGRHKANEIGLLDSTLVGGFVGSLIIRNSLDVRIPVLGGEPERGGRGRSSG